jgi:outer membrane protein assembly factor BamE (lipoprotein component of BamABCDE complex)
MSRIPALLLVAAIVAAPACTPLRSHQGYVVDIDLVNSVQPGVDTRETVAQVLGRPTVTGQFSDREWYYLARDSRNLAFNNPKPVNQTTLKVSFDEKGVVTGITRTGLEQVASINPSNKATPTLGRKRGFFQDLFGNIGSVGAAGAGAPGGGTGP